jgi:hypothetical protein
VRARTGRYIRGCLPGDLTGVVHCRTDTQNMNLAMKAHTSVSGVNATVAASIHVENPRYESRWSPTVHPAIGTPSPGWHPECWKH